MGRTGVVAGVWNGAGAIGGSIGLRYWVVDIMRGKLGNSTCVRELLLVGIAAHRSSIIVL